MWACVSMTKGKGPMKSYGIGRYVVAIGSALSIGSNALAQSAPQPAMLDNISGCSVEGGLVFVTTGQGAGDQRTARRLIAVANFETALRAG